MKEGFDEPWSKFSILIPVTRPPSTAFGFGSLHSNKVVPIPSLYVEGMVSSVCLLTIALYRSSSPSRSGDQGRLIVVRACWDKGRESSVDVKLALCDARSLTVSVINRKTYPVKLVELDLEHVESQSASQAAPQL